MLKRNKKILILLTIFIVFVLLINSVVSYIIKKKVDEFILENNSSLYTSRIENIKFNLFTRSITFHNIFLSPSEKSIVDLKEKKSKEDSLEKISINSIELSGIHLIKLLINTDVQVNNLNINGLLIQKFKNEKRSIDRKNPKKSFDLDSIYLKKLNGLQIDNINIADLELQVFDFSKNKITFQNKPLSFEFNGFKLESYDNNLYKLRPIEKYFEINDINISFPEKKYEVLVDAIQLNFEEKLINIKKFHLKPLIDKFALANSYQYNDVVFDINIKNLSLFNYDISKSISKQGIFMDSVLISQADIHLFKDKTKPWNKNKYKKLPHVALKQMELPLFINKIKIIDSDFTLKEKFDKRDILLNLTLNDISASLTNITSIKKYRKDPLKIQLFTKLMNKADLQASMTFPLTDNTTNFYFNGTLGPSKFASYDTALFPVLGLKILEGEVDQLTFDASADNYSSTGKMSMLYHDLDAKVFKSHSLEENKFLSWTVNTTIYPSNPGKNGKIRTAVLKHKRITYSGFGGYLWKTLQSGIINTIAPGGKTVEKEEKRKRRKAKRKN